MKEEQLSVINVSIEHYVKEKYLKLKKREINVKTDTVTLKPKKNLPQVKVS